MIKTNHQSLITSNQLAFRMISQGAVSVGGERISERDTLLPVNSSYVVQVGKRKFARVNIKESAE